MEYTGNYFVGISPNRDKHIVNVLEYKSDSKMPYCKCSYCGKSIVKTMYVVQNADTDVEEMYLGNDCAKRLIKTVKG